MSKVDILVKFRNTLVSFFDEMIELFPTNSDLIISRIYIKDQIPTETVMQLFSKHFLPHKQVILDKDEAGLIEGTEQLFQDMKLKTNLFHKIWKSEQLDDDNKQILWEWIHSILTIIDKYNNIVNSK